MITPTILISGLSATVATLALGELLALQRKGRLGWLNRERMPRMLRSAGLRFNETELQDSEGRTIRVDQVYALPNGKLVVVDTKTRRKHEVRRTDVEQLRRYRAALREVYGYAIHPTAYIRTVINNHSERERSVRYNPVRFS